MCVESSRTQMSITPDIFFHGEEKSGINSFILGAKFKLLMDSICEFMTLMNSEPQNKERTHILVDSSTSFFFYLFFFPFENTQNWFKLEDKAAHAKWGLYNKGE